MRDSRTGSPKARKCRKQEKGLFARMAFRNFLGELFRKEANVSRRGEAAEVRVSPSIFFMSMNIGNQPPIGSRAPEARSPDDEKLWQAARGMEANFMKEMVRAMRKTVPESDDDKNNRSLQLFRGMLDDEYSEKASQNGDGIGLAEMIVKQVKEMAEQQKARGRVLVRDLNKSDIIGK